MNKIEKIELEKSIKDLTARNNEIKGLILAENSLGNAEKLDAEYQANEIKIENAQNKLNENSKGETKMAKYIESKNSISDFMTILKDSNNKQDVKNKWNAKLAENLAQQIIRRKFARDAIERVLRQSQIFGQYV